MRRFVLALSLTVLPATAVSAQAVEQGYPRGSLAVAAIERGDWARAEALATWREALASDRHTMVATLGDRYVSTRDLAREALARYETITALR